MVFINSVFIKCQISFFLLYAHKTQAPSCDFNTLPVCEFFKPAVGKTTLGKSLEKGLIGSLLNIKKERDDDKVVERTRGVEVRPITIKGAEFSLWDYAGQEEVSFSICACVCMCVYVFLCVRVCVCMCVCGCVFYCQISVQKT